MSLPKLRVTVEVEIWPGDDNINIKSLKAVLATSMLAKHDRNLQALLTDAESAIFDWDNYGMPEMEIIE